MGKVRVYDVDIKERYQLVGELLDIITRLRSKKDTIDFVIGLLTASETLMIARRIQIAKAILQEKTYDEIRKALGVSYQTITKTEQWLKRGDQARQKTLQRYLLGPAKSKGNKTGYTQKNPEVYGSGMLDKYAHHRILRELLEDLIG